MAESVEQAALRRAGEVNILADVLDCVHEMQSTDKTLGRGLESAYQQIGQLHAELAEARDSLLALSNRLESVTQLAIDSVVDLREDVATALINGTTLG